MHVASVHRFYPHQAALKALPQLFKKKKTSLEDDSSHLKQEEKAIAAVEFNETGRHSGKSCIIINYLVLAGFVGARVSVGC